MGNFINDDIKIDFPVNVTIKHMMDKCEQNDKDDDYALYMNNADFLVYTLAKEAYVEGEITKKQWEKIEMRYPQ